MTREEAKQVFLSRGYVEVEGGTIYSPDKWREACVVISEWLEQEPCEDCISREAIKKDLKNCKVTEIRDEDDDLVGYYNADTVDSIVRNLPSVKQDCDNCEVGNPCLYCKHEFEPQERSEDDNN